MCNMYTKITRKAYNMLGDTIKILRESRGITQTQLANLIGISRDMLSNWETGRSKIHADYIRPISKALNYSADYILNYEYETEESYKKRFDKINGLINWAIRDEDNADMVSFLSNEFSGNFDGVVLMSYIYSKLPSNMRKHISAMIIYTFRSAYYENRTTNIDSAEFEAIDKKYISLWHELDRK